jgi:hypothetical protein
MLLKSRFDHGSLILVKAEEVLEFLEEALVQVLGKQIDLSLGGQLIEQLKLSWLYKGNVVVVKPSVIKVGLKPMGKVVVKWLVVVETRQKAKERTQFIALIDFCVELVELLQDLCEVAEDV